MLSMARKESNPEITDDARNTATQIGSLSLNIQGVINYEFGFPQDILIQRGLLSLLLLLYWWLT